MRRAGVISAVVEVMATASDFDAMARDCIDNPLELPPSFATGAFGEPDTGSFILRLVSRHAIGGRCKHPCH
eukprot:3472941-Pyramimonas_sp.AAC.1